MGCDNAIISDEWILDIYVHVTILLLVLSAAFWIFIAPLEKNTFEGQVIDQTHNAMNKAFKNVDTKDLKKDGVSERALPALSKYYSSPDAVTKDYNAWLLRVNIIILATVLIGFFVVVAILRYSCNRCIPIGRILAENALLFVCIGVVEVVFFLKVASKFVPITPSYIVNQFLTDLKKSL
jgi:hypothetical protein